MVHLNSTATCRLGMFGWLQICATCSTEWVPASSAKPCVAIAGWRAKRHSSNSELGKGPDKSQTFPLTATGSFATARRARSIKVALSLPAARIKTRPHDSKRALPARSEHILRAETTLLAARARVGITV